MSISLKLVTERAEIPNVPPIPRVKRAAQRILDVTVAVVAILVAFVPALIIAAFIKATSRGPVLFTQWRVGFDGTLFEVYKFRTMRQGTHEEVLGDESARRAYEANEFKLPSNDPRITSVGRVLRSTSVDELPQFLNVLRGEMSVVGVRPVEPAQLAQRSDYDQALYRRMRPGITGLWQVEGRSTIGGVDRLALERRHLERWSVKEDLKIIIRTPLALLRVSHAH